MGLQRVMGWLVPRNDKFYALLEKQASIVGEAAHIIASFPENGRTSEAALADLHEVEHRGDDLVRSMNTGLLETFVLPIDREDLHSLTTTLDNILDYLDAAAHAFVSREVHHFSPAMREMIKLCVEAAAVVQGAVPLIRKRRLPQIALARQQIAVLEKRGDDVYRTEMAALYRNGDLAAKELLRHRGVLDALEEALDSCQAAADMLQAIALKHS